MTDRLIRMTMALAVMAVAVVAAVISYQHANELVRSHGESGLTARLLHGGWADLGRIHGGAGRQPPEPAGPTAVSHPGQARTVYLKSQLDDMHRVGLS